MKKIINEMKLRLPAVSINESVARAVVSAFFAELNPSIEELADVRCAVSEAVTNCIVHAYQYDENAGSIVIECRAKSEDGQSGVLHITVADKGCGIDDLEKAMTPFFTTMENDERSGMGFTIMQTFMNGFLVESEKGKGTKVSMTKKIGWAENGVIKEQMNA